MQANKKRDTAPELRLRSALHRLGVRFRLNWKIHTQPPVFPDLVIANCRVAVFLDGCFWHGCPVHGTRPRTNSDYWIPKIERNMARDRIVDEAVGRIGWLALRIWEHEDPVDAAKRVRSILQDRVAISEN